MTEQDVTLTDFAIAMQAAIYLVLLARGRTGAHRGAWAMLFAGTALAGLTGGLVHGYFLDPAHAWHAPLWALTLIAIAAAAAGLLQLAVRVGNLSSATVRRCDAIIVLLLLLVAAYAVTGLRPFAIAVLAYAPASLALGAACLTHHRRHGERASLVGAGAMGLGLLAGLGQQVGYTPAPALISANAFFHVLQMIALAALFSVRDRLANPPGQRGT